MRGGAAGFAFAGLCALAIVVGLCLAAMLVAGTLDVIKGGGESNQDREDRLYRECLAAGGSWSTDDVDFTCEVKP